VSEDWAAVARAINERVNELGWRQHELAERAQVSQAIVRELQRNTVQRRRSARTLEALSVTLGWHPRHLAAVLHGRRPPAVGEPAQAGDISDPVSARLAAIEDHLREIAERLDKMNANLEAAIDHAGGTGER
jgi:transcriptional regulator with XRE-family HTH domain